MTLITMLRHCYYCYIHLTDQESAAQRAKVLLYFHQGKADTLVSQITLYLNSVDLFTLS